MERCNIDLNEPYSEGSDGVLDLTLGLRPPIQHLDHLLLPNPFTTIFSQAEKEADRKVYGEGIPNDLDERLNYNPHQIGWSRELKTYVMKSDKPGQLIAGSFSTKFTMISASNHYVIISDPTKRKYNKRATREGGGSSLRRRRESRRGSICNDQTKRCTNYECNTTDTPLWRRGPLGPQTLCNACGIRYRKLQAG